MTELTDGRQAFADRLRDAVRESTATDRGRRAGRGGRARHKHRRVTTPMSAPVANPSRVRYSDELFVDRIRKALD